MREALFLVTVLALAGCVTPTLPADVDPAGVVPAGWAEVALLTEHDHDDRAAHAPFSTANFEIVGWDPLVGKETGATTSNLCGDAREADGRRLAVTKSGGDVAFTIADVTDPAAPQWLGEFVLRTSYVYDVTVLPGATRVALVTSNHRTPDALDPTRAEEPLALSYRTACAPGWRELPVPAAAPGDDLLPRPRSVLVVNVEDPAAPFLEAWDTIVGVGHSVSSADVDGRTIVLASALGCTSTSVAPGVPPPLPVQRPFRCPSWAAMWHFFELTADGDLDRLSTYMVPLTEETFARGNYHNDGTIAKHPVTGQWLAYLVGWDDGLHVLDISTPEDPAHVASWSDHDPAGDDEDSGNFHSVFPLPALRDGRHYTVIGPEHGGKPTTRPTGVVWVLDTTDPAAPTPVAGWTLPHEPTWQGFLQFSPHYVAVQDERLYVSNYHGGLWAVDFSPVGSVAFASLPSLGVFVPTRESPKPAGSSPSVGEVFAFDDGSLVTFDGGSGLYVLRYREDVRSTAAEPWPLEAP